jgi:hypothetical protein
VEKFPDSDWFVILNEWAQVNVTRLMTVLDNYESGSVLWKGFCKHTQQ